MGRNAEEYLRLVRAGLSVHDAVSVSPETLLDYVRASLAARRELPYAKEVPEELFRDYVLPPKVNNEHLDGSRSWLYAQLRDRVAGRTMQAAALEVNYWCCEQATYTPADDRTIGPRGMILRGRGRCGEESTLAVAALRSVCIPARQVYAPWWAHCDDNHAWVEFWAEGAWHYMGACEPEERPDVGWFTAAASRAMLIRARVPDLQGGLRVVNVTGRYGDTAILTVRLERAGRPQAGVLVQFRLVNYSRLATLHEEVTDETGTAHMETGLGDLVVSACWEGRLVERKLDLRQSREVTLRWEEGRDPLAEEWTDTWELVPPTERVPAPAEQSEAHLARLANCDGVRKSHETAPDAPHWLRLAGGNRGEVEKFLALPDFSEEDKAAILDTLREKDFADITCETLEDALLCALPYKEKYKPLVWENWVLAPRVENEMLLPIRCEIAARLAGEGLRDGPSVLHWMDQHLRFVDDHGMEDRRADAAGCLRYGCCPASQRQVLAVQLCRALGIPAFLECGMAYGICPDGAARRLEGERPGACLTLVTGDCPLHYGEHYTLSRWENGDYCTVDLDCTPLKGASKLHLPQGAYSLLTARRQIDGSVSARAFRFRLTGDRTVEVALAPDKTAEKLQDAVLLPVKAIGFTDAEPSDLTAKTVRGSLLVFAQPGAEPTEHLFQELLELAESCARGGWPIHILLQSREEAENATLRRLLAALPSAHCFLAEPGAAYNLRQAMGVGDARLPLAAVLDQNGHGRHATANYNVGSGSALLGILNLLEE